MSSENMREEFEAWAVADAGSTCKQLKFERGGEWYLGRDHQVMNLGWAAWQASRAAVVVELPEVCEDEIDQVGGEQLVRYYPVRGVLAAIEAAGLKVSP
jgi:hypothetical protein